MITDQKCKNLFDSHHVYTVALKLSVKLYQCLLQNKNRQLYFEFRHQMYTPLCSGVVFEVETGGDVCRQRRNDIRVGRTCFAARLLLAGAHEAPDTPHRAWDIELSTNFHEFYSAQRRTLLWPSC